MRISVDSSAPLVIIGATMVQLFARVLIQWQFQTYQLAVQWEQSMAQWISLVGESLP